MFRVVWSSYNPWIVAPKPPHADGDSLLWKEKLPCPIPRPNEGFTDMLKRAATAAAVLIAPAALTGCQQSVAQSAMPDPHPQTITASATDASIDDRLNADTITDYVVNLPAGNIPRYNVQVAKGVSYGVAPTLSGQLNLVADVYTPLGDAPADGWPLLVYAHGGSFRFGERGAPDMIEFSRHMATTGMIVASIDYRLSTADPLVTTPGLAETFSESRNTIAQTHLPKQGLLAAIEDLAAATAYFRQLHSVRDDAVFISGDSAGAMAANYLAYGPANAQINVEWSPENLTGGPIAGVVSLWGGTPFTPHRVTRVDRGAPPAFIVHGGGDPVVPVSASSALAGALRRAGTPNRFVERRNVGHSFSRFDMYHPHGNQEPVADQIARFLHHLTPEPALQ